MLDDVRSALSARANARALLDAAIAGGVRHATEASFARLVDAVAHGGWSEEAEARLKAEGHDRPALVLRAFYLGERHADWKQALALFDGIDDRRWALPARLRVAARLGRHCVLRAAADDMMAAAPGQVSSWNAVARMARFAITGAPAKSSPTSPRMRARPRPPGRRIPTPRRDCRRIPGRLGPALTAR